jgi:hypothetical protein
MNADQAVSCSTHGKQRPAYVCQHVVSQIKDNVARGLVWEYAADEGHFEAFCHDCAALIDSNGGDLTDELDLEVGCTLICEACLDGVLKLNGMTRFN